MEELKIYVGCKIIQAIPMDECSFLRMIKNEDTKDRETRAGYKVIYPPDGYVSWSPKEIFELCYREMTEEEKALT